MLKGNNKYTRTVTRTFDMLTCFELAAPRHHCTRHTGDIGNMNNNGSHGGWDHTLIQHTAPSGTVFTPGLDDHK